MKKGTITTISTIIGAGVGVIIGGIGFGALKQQQINSKTEKVDKFKGYYNLLNQWLMIKQSGKTLETYFIDKGFKSIAIYGMGEMGTRLYDELKNTEIEIKYAIDKNALSSMSEIEVVETEDNFEKVDAIIVTATFAFIEIEEELKKKVDYPIVSLEDVVFES